MPHVAAHRNPSWRLFTFFIPLLELLTPAPLQAASCLNSLGWHDVGSVFVISEPRAGMLLIGAERGLFRGEGDTLVQIADATKTGPVKAIHENTDGSLLIGAEKGLFHQTADGVVSIGHYNETGGIRVLRRSSDGTLLVGADQGLFRREGNDLIRIGERTSGAAQVVYEREDRTIWVGTEYGLFRREGDELVSVMARDGAQRVPVGAYTGSVNAIHARGSTLLIGADAGIFVYGNEALNNISNSAALSHDNILRFHETKDGVFLVGTVKKGLFRRTTDNFVSIGKGVNIGAIWALHELSDGILLVGTQKGGFRAGYQPWHGVKAPPAFDTPLITKIPYAFEWKLAHPCVSALKEDDISLSGVPEDWITFRRGDKASVYANIIFRERKDDPYNIQLNLKEDSGQLVPVGPPVSVRVGWELGDYFKHYGAYFAIALFIVHTAVFNVLIVGSRWSPFCWRIVTDSVWGRAGLWFYFSVRHLRPIQHWIMARWFNSVRQKTSGEPYLPITLTDSRAVAYRSTDLLKATAKWPRLWIQGNAGMGKTAMILHLQSTFFADQTLPTLRDAFARFGCVPIIVPLVEYRDVAFNPAHPEDWIPSVARMAVSASGVPFEDHALFRAMIKSGGFLLVLDGANEVERENEIDLFARSAPAVRILVTSQARGSEYFINWRLPPTMRDEIEPLLRLFLGQDRGGRAYRCLASTPLLDIVRSGYDVRLIADLVEDRGMDAALPRDRIELYQLIIDSVRTSGDPDFSDESLCKAAWGIWTKGERKLEAEKDLDANLLRSLTQKRQKVLRVVSGKEFRFRHDQMRAYLAACWVARYEVNTIGLLENTAAIWRLSRTEQTDVWNFFADILVSERPKEAVEVWKWSTAHPDRAILQHCLQRALKEKSCVPDMVEA